MAVTVLVNPNVAYHVESACKDAATGKYIWTLDPTPYAQKMDAERERMKANQTSHKKRRLVLFLNGERFAEFERNAHRSVHDGGDSND